MSVVMPSASPSKLRMTRWRIAGIADVLHVLEADVEPAVEQGADLARQLDRLRGAGLAPTRRNWLTIGIANWPCGWVASVQRIA